MPAAIVDAQKQFRKFFFGAAVAGLVVGCLILPAQATTINFDGLSGNSCLCVPFTSYKESGFTVSTLSGSWVVDDYGNPGPSTIFMKTTSFDTTDTASIAVTDAGAHFRFNSIDLYSSVTPIPYSLTGLLNGNTVFTTAGTVPNTFGAFAKVSNPAGTDMIDTLQVILSNPATPFCSTCATNPVGLDNIVVAPDLVLEPGTLTLLASALAGLVVIRRRAIQAPVINIWCLHRRSVLR